MTSAPVEVSTVRPLGERIRDAARGIRRIPPAHLVVAAAVAFSGWCLRGNLTDAILPSDAAIHASLVRWVAARLGAGHLPFDGWYPYLSLGAPRFHHYQSLPHILLGTLVHLAGTPRLFQWSLYLLLSTWPIGVYIGARLLGLERAPAAAAALVAPLLVSQPRMGLEWGTYSFRGYGAWAQLCGMWLLPIVLGVTWRAIAFGRRRALAALLLAAMIATHMILAYIALFAVPIWVLLGGPRRERLRRAIPIVVAALLASAWFWVPVVLERQWMTRDVFSLGSPGYDGFGLWVVLDWFVGGNLLDRGRLPTLSVLVLVGLVVAVRRRAEEPARLVLALLALSLFLLAGRRAFGAAFDLIPGASDVFLRRFIAGVHLAALFLAGIGIVGVITWARGDHRGRARVVSTGLAMLATVLALAPAVVERRGYSRLELRLIAVQEAAESVERRGLDALLSYRKPQHPGRVYAGMVDTWGGKFQVGGIPVFSGLLSRDVDAVGFVRPTWSLLSNVEALFDDSVAELYPVYGIRYVLLPDLLTPPPSAVLLASSGTVRLFEIPDGGYLRVVRTRGSLVADRSDLVAKVGPFLSSQAFLDGVVPTIGYAGRVPAEPMLAEGDIPPGVPAGDMVAERAWPEEGRFEGTAQMVTEGVVVLSAPFDPGWTARVDGRRVATEMVAPGMVGVRVPPGSHVVAFSWEGFGAYWVLVPGLLAPLALALGDRRRRLDTPAPDPHTPTVEPG